MACIAESATIFDGGSVAEPAVARSDFESVVLCVAVGSVEECAATDSVLKSVTESVMGFDPAEPVGFSAESDEELEFKGFSSENATKQVPSGVLRTCFVLIGNCAFPEN